MQFCSEQAPVLLKSGPCNRIQVLPCNPTWHISISVYPSKEVQPAQGWSFMLVVRKAARSEPSVLVVVNMEHKAAAGPQFLYVGLCVKCLLFFFLFFLDRKSRTATRGAGKAYADHKMPIRPPPQGQKHGSNACLTYMRVPISKEDICVGQTVPWGGLCVRAAVLLISMSCHVDAGDGRTYM
ncbi:hypothetical protein GGR52DRAFT_190223 [Hypoxylon sp. FL1284]|nr:hypothetical protein GGR52DRAFT_190223 [Hypoxylon sp. FL1284]